jgi:hypothetical protein
MNPRRTATLEPAPTSSRGGERAARVLVALVAAGLLAIALWPALAERAAPVVPDPGWGELAPPPEVRMPTWRWLVVSAVAREAHLRLGASHDDAARVEQLPAWRLQRAVPGYPADAVVVLVGRGDPAALERRCVAVAAELLRRIPTLGLARLGADRHGAPPGLDQERLRFLVRERLGR